MSLPEEGDRGTGKQEEIFSCSARRKDAGMNSRLFQSVFKASFLWDLNGFVYILHSHGPFLSNDKSQLWTELSLPSSSSQGDRGTGVQRTEGLHGDEQYLIWWTHSHLQVGPPAVRSCSHSHHRHCESSWSLQGAAWHDNSVTIITLPNIRINNSCKRNSRLDRKSVV